MLCPKNVIPHDRRQPLQQQAQLGLRAAREMQHCCRLGTEFLVLNAMRCTRPRAKSIRGRQNLSVSAIPALDSPNRQQTKGDEIHTHIVPLDEFGSFHERIGDPDCFQLHHMYTRFGPRHVAFMPESGLVPAQHLSPRCLCRCVWTIPSRPNEWGRHLSQSATTPTPPSFDLPPYK